jgi:hypothetical protein
MTTVIIKRPNPLTVEDFKSQLYGGLIDVRGMSMLPRVEIEWGQRTISIVASEFGEFSHFGVYDRREDGEPLDIGALSGLLNIAPKDTVIITVYWKNFP